MDWIDFLHEAIRVPFKEHGRDYDGWDCWGLVVCGYRDVLGIELPDYSELYDSTRKFKRLSEVFCDRRDNGQWVAGGSHVGSVAVILRRQLPIHEGIVFQPGAIIQCEEGVNTVVDYQDKLKIEGFYSRA